MAPPSSATASTSRPSPIVNAAIKAGVTTFALGAAMAIHEGHGDPPTEQHESPNPTGHVAIEFLVSSTSSMTAHSSYVSMWSPSSSLVRLP
jgi:hypothetical protein